MLSYYGKEHFCPLSLLRVLGASMMEVYEEAQGGGAGGVANGGHTFRTIPPSEGFGEGQSMLHSYIDTYFQLSNLYKRAIVYLVFIKSYEVTFVLNYRT